MKKPDWQLFAYRVDFQPEVESRGFRNYLIASQKDMIGGYLFDGTQMFCARKLDNEIIERAVKGQNGETVLVTFKYTRSVAMTEMQSLQILNLILRRSMDGLKMQLIGRNFFDPDAKVSISAQKKTNWIEKKFSMNLFLSFFNRQNCRYWNWNYGQVFVGFYNLFVIKISVTVFSHKETFTVCLIELKEID